MPVKAEIVESDTLKQAEDKEEAKANEVTENSKEVESPDENEEVKEEHKVTR